MAAINWTLLKENRMPVPLPQEGTHYMYEVEKGMEVTIFSPLENASETKKMMSEGRAWLTDQRIIFVSSKPVASTSTTSFNSLSIPLHSIRSSSYVQPIMSANHHDLEVEVASNGGLTKGTKIEIRINGQTLMGFYGAVEKAREHVGYERRRRLMEQVDSLPVYTSGTSASTSTAALDGSNTPTNPQSIPPPNEAPPGYDD